MPRTLLIPLVCLFAFQSSKPAQAQFSRQIIDAGWYQGGLHNPFNTNYITGQASGTETRSFFLFDVPDAAGAITSATLRIPRFEVWSPDASEFLDIYDVTTDLTDLVEGNGGLPAFGDLGSGVSYGSYEIQNIAGVEYIDVPLNSTAVAALNSSPGQFAFGGSLSSIDGPEDQAAFAFSSGGAPELILNPTNTPIGPYSTELHPVASAISIEVILGDINNGGVVAAAIENIPLHGTVNASHLLNENNTGILQFDSSDLVMENISDYFVDLGLLGGFTLDLNDARINLQTGIIPVTNSEFLMDDAESMVVAIDDGDVLLQNPTGLIASLYGDDFFLLNDFGASPVAADLDDILGLGVGGTIDQGAGYFTKRGEINLEIPEVSFLLETELDLDVYVRISGSVHVAVPEPSTWCLGLLGAAGVVLLERRNKSGGHRRWLMLLLSVVSLHAFASSPAAAQPPIASHWLNAVDGDWVDGSLWSTTPQFPNNDLPTVGDQYDVFIDATGGAYTVSLKENVNVSSITLDSTDATLWHESGSLDVDIIDIKNGTFRLGDEDGSQTVEAEIVGATITGDQGVFIVEPHHGTVPALNNVTLGVDTILQSTTDPNLVVRNGLTLTDGATIAIEDRRAVMRIDGSQTIGGTGEIVFRDESLGGAIELIDNTTLTIGAGVSVRATTTGGQIGIERGDHFPPENVTLVNEGLLSGEAAQERLDVMNISVDKGSTFENRGVVQAIGDGTVIVGGAWTNTGTLRLRDNGSIWLDGSFTPADIGTIDRQGGTLAITGTVENTGGTFTASAATGDLQLNSGLIRGGTLATADGANWDLAFGTLEDVTIVNDAYLQRIQVDGNLTVNNATIDIEDVDLIGNATTGTTLGGNGVIRYAAGERGDLTNLDSGTVVITPTLTIDYSNANATLAGAHSTLINQGTIRDGVDGPSASGVMDIRFGDFDNQGLIEVSGLLRILPNGAEETWTNNGTIRLKSGSRATFGGNYSIEDFGTIIDEGVNEITLAGTLDNQGKSLDLNGFGWAVNSTRLGTILGGVVGSSGAQPYELESAIFDGVTLATDIKLKNLGSSLSLRNDLTLDDAEIVVSEGASLGFSNEPGSQRFLGTGTILAVSDIGASGVTNIGGSRLVIGEDITIRNGTERFRELVVSFKENFGTIISEAPDTLFNIGDRSITALDESWVNHGVIRVEAGKVQFNGIYTLANIGTIERVGGTVTSAGTLKNQGTTLLQDATTGAWEIRGTVEGGRIETRDGIVAMLGATLDGVTFAGEGTIPSYAHTSSSGSALIQNSLTLDAATLTVGPNRELSISGDGPVLIDGVGEILLNGTTNSTRIQTFTGSELTIGSGVTVKTGPQGGGSISRSSLPMINHGKISAETSGQAIVLGGSLENTGVLQAKNGSILSVTTNSWTNEGQIKIDSGGVIQLLAEQFENGTDGTITGNGTIYLGRQIDPRGGLDSDSPTGLDPVATDADAFVNSGTIAPGVDGIGTLMFAGNLQLSSSSIVEIELGDVLLDEMDQLFVQGVFGLNGDLEVSLSDGFIPRLGEEFEILQGVMSGAFQNIDSEFQVGNILFGISYYDYSVTLTALSEIEAAPLLAVPEPSTAVLASIGVIFVASSRYRRRSKSPA